MNRYYIIWIILIAGLLLVLTFGTTSNDNEDKKETPVIKTVGERPTLWPSDFCLGCPGYDK